MLASLQEPDRFSVRPLVLALVVCGLASILLAASQAGTVGMSHVAVGALAIGGQVALGSLLARRPALALLAAHTLMLVVALGLRNAFVTQVLTYLPLAYHLGRRRGGALTWTVVLAVLGSSVLLYLALPRPDPVLDWDWGGVAISSLGAGMLLVVLPALVGQRMRWQAERLDIVVRLAESQRQEARSATASALQAERARMARELHDVAAHHMTAVMINAKAARKRAAGAEPEVLAFLDEIAGEATRATRSLQEVVGILRADEDDADQAPTPSLEDVPDLIARAQKINGKVRLSMRDEDEFRAVPPAVGLAAYRIVQESLTNAHRHAPGAPVAVLVRIEDGALHVVVENDAPDTAARFLSGSGRGVCGMRSRAVGLGGELQAGPTRDGWRVSARIPCNHGNDEGE